MSWSLLIELIGTVAFAVSGALIGLKKDTDLLGVICLGVITATGGGMMRDIFMGVFPPIAFVKPIYVSCATITTIVVFLVAKYQLDAKERFPRKLYNDVLFYMDSLGLGIFTVMGVIAAMNRFSFNNAFFCIFSGVTTGVGGGLIRDVIVDRLPDIFTKHIYAVASIVGAILTYYLLCYTSAIYAMVVGTAVVVIIRSLSRKYQWNLPKIENYEQRHKKCEK